MKRIDRCFLVKGGVSVILEPSEGKSPNMKDVSAQLGVEEGGLALMLGDYIIPLPENMFEYITENRLVTLYQPNNGEYCYRPTANIELDKDLLIEAKAVYRYHKSILAESGRDKQRLDGPSTP